MEKQFNVTGKCISARYYNEDGEQQICDYLDYLHNDTGYMLTFNFNKSKEMKIEKKLIRGKTIFEAFV